MKLKELSSATDISERTIRYYISDGVFVPERYSESYTGRKSYDYTDNDVRRLKQIALLRKYDFSIKDIKLLNNCDWEIDDALRKQIKESNRIIETAVENSKKMKAALANHPKDVNTLCELLSTPLKETAPIPIVDEKSSYEPLYDQASRNSKLFIFSIIVLAVLAFILASALCLDKIEAIAFSKITGEDINSLIEVKYSYLGEVDNTVYDPFTYFYGYEGDNEGKKVVAYSITVKNISSDYLLFDIKQAGKYNNEAVYMMSYDIVLFDGYLQSLSPEESAEAVNYCIVNDTSSDEEIFNDLQLCNNPIQFKIRNINNHSSLTADFEIIGEWDYQVD